MKETWNELMQAYSQILDGQSIGVFKVTDEQANAVVTALKQFPRNTSGETLSQLAQANGGLPSDRLRMAGDMLKRLEKIVPDGLERLLERSIYFANQNPMMVVRPRLSPSEAFMAEQMRAHPQVTEPVQESKPGILGRVFNAAVNWLMSKPAEEISSETVESSQEQASQKEIPSAVQIEDAWRRLIKTYEDIAKDYREKEALPFEEKLTKSFDAKTAQTTLINSLSHFQQMVSHLDEKELHRTIHAFSESRGLPKDDYASVFGKLRSMLPMGSEQRELFVETFEPAALSWKIHAQRDERIEEAWKHLVSVYKVIAENVENSGNIRLFSMELRNFQKVAAEFGAKNIEHKVTALMEKFGSPTGKSPDENAKLLIKLKEAMGQEADGQKLFNVLELTLRTPPSGESPRNSEQQHVSHK